MKAVVMAGGFGTRIQPLTNSIPKPMLPIMNRPMMEHTIVSLRDLGVKEFIILLYFKPEIIKEYFGDGSALGINITYITPDSDYGTAGAVKKAQEYIGDESFIIISGDLVTDFNFQEIFDYHKAKNSKLTITLTSVENPLEFGVVIANEEGKIEKFLEKPSWGEVFSDTINTGIYIIEPEILDYIPENENFDFAKDLFPLLMHKGVDLIAGYAQGYWRDVGNPESYRDLYDDIFSKKIKFQLSGKAIKYPDGILLYDENTQIDKSVEITGIVLIGKNATIEKGSKLNNVVMGNSVHIGDSSKISNCIIWDDVEIGKNAKLDGCVICNKNKIGKNVTARAGLILAEECEVGELVTIEKDVTIWPSKVIEDAAIVGRSIILGSKYKNSIFEYGMVVGKSNVELSCEMATKLAEAFGAQLPLGSTVLVSRHHGRSSRMLKRAFLGGLLSAGVNVVDCNAMLTVVMQSRISLNDNYVAGVSFHQKINDPTSTVITFYNSEALRINNEVAKKVEKAFFKETFRRVEYSQIGQIYEIDQKKEYQEYRKSIESVLQARQFKCHDCRIAVDLTHGLAAEIFPDILNDLGIEHIMFNSYEDDKRLLNIDTLLKRSYEDMGAVVRALHLDAGFILYPHGQRLDIVCDNGVTLSKQTALHAILSLLDMEAKVLGTKKSVFLPTWAADIMRFEHLIIIYGQSSNFEVSELKKYDLVSTENGNYTFTEFSAHGDSMYSTLKILTMILTLGQKLSDIVKSLPKFFYTTIQLECQQSLKGKMMRKFLQHAKGKRSSTLNGVKIWLDEDDWILMIPDQYNDKLNVTVQAVNDEKGEYYMQKYREKIKEWKA
ncbi:sugar phosphate nucleotidyltransferase [Sulfurimonas sp.]|uniref:sugar phosphate nucleotidyltransferase n=1 Tax=Sulfurimonas sp. TaxID=2022749 RepID=UPI0025EBC866|nr:sugar phosphate nucleotidyltransferase [Sulfurimonas sp.]MDD5157031.1 sugar phosphate nucleotidyltransferase [Sulfurimonas sp.]